jgi:DNA-binding transcriptional regulator LsrR (DeoR family)
MSRKSGSSKQHRDLLARVAYLSLVKGWTQERIGKRLNPTKDQATVARLLAEAWESHVISYDIDPDFAITGAEDEDLADRLRDEFGMQDPLVIEFDGSDDDMHLVLANETGLRKTHIESNQHVAVAGGRAIVRLCRVISRNPPSVRDVVVTPLGGRLWSGLLSATSERGPRHLEQPLNPDYSALILAVGLHAGHEPGIRFSQVSHPLYAENHLKAQSIIRENCAFLPSKGWNFELNAPDQAFVGVGAISRATNHRLAEYIDTQSNFPVDSAFEQLRQAVDFADQNNLPRFGDVANRVFPCLPLPSSLKGGTDQLELYSTRMGTLSRMLEQINARSVVMNWGHLRDIKRVRAVAGGNSESPKVNALLTLLLSGVLNPAPMQGRLITSLSTNSAMAETLLKEKTILETLPIPIQLWYRRRPRKIEGVN